MLCSTSADSATGSCFVTASTNFSANSSGSPASRDSSCCSSQRSAATSHSFGGIRFTPQAFGNVLVTGSASCRSCTVRCCAVLCGAVRWHLTPTDGRNGALTWASMAVASNFRR